LGSKKSRRTLSDPRCVCLLILIAANSHSTHK
jgi:hypothetical protein